MHAHTHIHGDNRVENGIKNCTVEYSDAGHLVAASCMSTGHGFRKYSLSEGLRRIRTGENMTLLNVTTHSINDYHPDLLSK